MAENQPILAPAAPQVEYRPIALVVGYRVGDDGSVWSCLERNKERRGQRVPGTKWHKLKPQISKGYLRVKIYYQGKFHRRLVHRLVLEAFVGPCPPGHECAHDDGDRSNCSRSNLAWKTRPENTLDRFRHGKVYSGKDCWNAKLTDDKVRELVRRVDAGESRASVARDFGITKSHAAQVYKGRVWKNWKNLFPITPTSEKGK